MRLMSYISVLISLLFSFFLLNKYFTTRVAILFIALSAFTPGVIYYAQEVRSYALLYAFANIETILFVIFLAKIKNDKNIKNTLYTLYVIIGIALCYTHFFGYILVFSLSLTLVVYSIFSHRKNTTFYLFTISFLIAIVGIIWLFILFYYGDIADKAGGNFWIKNNYFSLFSDVADLLFGNLKAMVIGIFLVFLMIFPLSQFIRSFIMNQIILFPILLVLLVSILISLHTPILTSRNLIIIIPAVLLFLTFVFDDIYDKNKLKILLYLSLLFFATAWKSFTYDKQNWRDASQYIQKNFDKKLCKIPIDPRIDRVIEVPWLRTISYYLGTQYSYLTTGPKEQIKCDLIYFEGHKSKKQIEKDLIENNITIPYEVLDFHGVYVVIKK